jgi:hypothetical protein
MSLARTGPPRIAGLMREKTLEIDGSVSLNCELTHPYF